MDGAYSLGGVVTSAPGQLAARTEADGRRRRAHGAAVPPALEAASGVQDRTGHATNLEWLEYAESPL